MATYLESNTSSETQTKGAQPSDWLKIGLVAVASALLGGVGAAWWYRKTLIRMRRAEETGSNPQFGMPDEPPSDEM